MDIAEQIKAVVARLESTGQPFEVIDGSDRIKAIEAKFGRRLPESFLQLVETALR